MSQDSYFKNFPIINYNDNNAVDITKRIVLLNNVSKNPYLFYPYEISSDERADQFSHRYYEDQFKSWVLYLSNDMVDPYYEWYMEDDVFNNFIKKKYGSIEEASLKIKHYTCNWEPADPITVGAYNSLVTTLKKYWEPDYQNSKRIIQYKRKKIEQIHNTNKIVKYVVEDSSNFKKGEICKIDSANPFGQIGRGQITSIVGNVIYLQHIIGDSIFDFTNEEYVYNMAGRESSTVSQLVSSTLIQNNLLLEEEVYWSPLTYYQYELDKNAYNKTIKVLDKSYVKQLANNLESILK
jgi:hypothetical protein